VVAPIKNSAPTLLWLRGLDTLRRRLSDTHPSIVAQEVPAVGLLRTPLGQRGIAVTSRGDRVSSR
jgi:hypothetical protein